MSKRVVYLTDEQWSKIEPLIPKSLPYRKEVVPGPTIAWFLMEYSGYSRQEPVGKIFLTSTRIPKRAGVGSRSGMKPRCSRRCGVPFSHSWMPTESLTGKNRSSTQPSSLQKKGRGGWKNQEGEGNEVHGGGRRPGYSSGKPYRLCFASRGQACRNDNRPDQSPQKRTGKTEDAPKKSDRRQGVR